LFVPFTVGDVNQINSTPGNKPPSSEDTIEGRYAGVLFSSASEQEALFTVYEDIVYIHALYNNSESFKMFTKNTGVGAKEIRLMNEALQSVGTFHPLTMKFLEVLAENKRLIYI
jgi:F-type H+-transporting ATPase subunit O